MSKTIYLSSEGRNVAVTALSPREKRLLGVAKTRPFVSQKERIKKAPLSAYQAMLIKGGE